MTFDAQVLQMAALFDYFEDVLVWVKDRDGRYRWVNRAFLLRYAAGLRDAGAEVGPGDLVGKTDYDLSPPFLADQFRIDDEHVLAGGRIVNRIELVGQPGEPNEWYVTYKIPLADARGAVVGTAGMTRRLDAARDDLAPGSRFGPVLAHMRDHYQAPITNERLARMAHLSVRAFERKFHASFHLTPQKYLRRLRLRMASRSLVHTGLPIADVALGCGFVDQSHFTREFRREFGRTPRDYRDHYARLGADAGPITKPAGGGQSRTGGRGYPLDTG